MIQYRTFRNPDPPRILELWNHCPLGRSGARPQSTDVFEVFNYSQLFFDPAGLILACDGPQIVGLCHAGFCCTDDESRLDYSRGVICLTLVHPDYNRQGIGRELVRRAEAYLAERGAVEIFAGPSPHRDPFYFGLYGGTRPSGFLESDPLAHSFFLGVGYIEHERHGVYQRNLAVARDPINLRIAAIRRQTELTIVDKPYHPTWWWYTHFGRWDSAGIDLLRFRLVRKQDGEPLAGVTVIGLDQYIPVWQKRAIGLVDLFVVESLRGQGYGQTLLVEVLRRLRQELIDLAEVHAPDANQLATRVIQAAGFERVDTGAVYRKP
ncbi:MAG: GNAT family N-acetyltransferase [Planctomycetaceae bacterium]|nr:GNAT family N-acetyltransferase [Planctomycetaceae bacterium]